MLLSFAVSRVNWWALGVKVVVTSDVISFNMSYHIVCSNDGCFWVFTQYRQPSALFIL